MRALGRSLLLLVLFPLTSFAADVQGTLPSNTTWTVAGSPWRLVGDVTVPAGVTLTIEPNAQVVFASGDTMGSGASTSKSELIVHGALHAQGTSSTPVTITATSGYGLRVESGGSATLDHVALAGASGSYGIQSAGALTVTNTTVTGGNNCLSVIGGVANFSSGKLVNCSTGLSVMGGTATVEYSLFEGNSSYGAYVDAPATLSHNTIVSSGTGVYVDSFTGTVTLVDNSITHNNGYGIRFYSTASPSRSVHHNNVWSNSSGSYSSVTAGPGSISENPIYVGGGNYRPTENSPLRFAASDQTDIGAFAYAGDPTPDLRGVLFTNKTLSGANTLTGDLTVRQGVTLTIAPGASVTFATSDAQASGIDTSDVELIVHGMLAVQGSAASRVGITQTSAYGIRVGATGVVAMDYADIVGGSGTIGIDTAGTVTASNTNVTGGNTCLNVTGGTTTFSSGKLANCGTGLSVVGGTATVEYSLIEGSSSYGAYVDAPATLSHNTIVSSGTGVYVDSFTGTVTVVDNIITNSNGYGVRFYSTTSPSRSVHHNNVWSNSSGNYSGASAGAGSLSINPLYVSPGFNYTLQETSPCRNAASDGTDLGAFPYQPVGVAYIVITPASPTLAVNGTQQFTATAYDAQDNPLPSTTFTWSASAAAGSVSSTGLFTAGCTPGTYNAAVTASAGGKSASASLTLTTAQVATVTVSPSSVILAPNATHPFSATAYDACSNAVTTPITWLVTSGGGSISTQGLFTAGSVPGTWTNTVRATAGGVHGFASVTVQPAAVATIEVTPAAISIPIHGTRQFTAVAKDASGNVLPATITWSVINGGGSMDASGLFTAGTSVGTFTDTVRASSGGISGDATVTVTPGALASIVVSPATATLIIGGTRQFIATGRDSAGNTVPANVTWSVVNGGGTIDAGGLFTAGPTPGTFSNTIRATSGSITGHASVTVETGALASLTLSPNQVTLAPGATQQFTATGKDASGNTVPASVTWSVVAGGGSISPAGLFTAGTIAGTFTQTVQARSGSITALASVEVTPGSVQTVEVTPGSASLKVRGTRAFSAKARDGWGNVVPTSPTWSVSSATAGTIDGSGQFTAGGVAGSFPGAVVATVSGVSGSADVTLAPGDLAMIALSPSDATVAVGGVLQFSAMGEDVDGNLIPVTPVWSIQNGAGSISQEGLFTATQVPGSYPESIRAVFNGVVGSAHVTVTSGAIARVAVVPANPTVAVNGTITFTARAFDAFDNEVLGLDASWAVVKGGGTIDANGRFTAGTEPGTYAGTVQATVSGIIGTTAVEIATDFDGDGLPDDWELAHGFDPNDPADAALDPDEDGLSNLGELQATTDPRDADSDDDGVLDGNERRPGEDTDGDGLVNALDPDSDNDGLLDGTEMAVTEGGLDADPSTSTDPLVADTDGDGRSDGDEDLDHNGRVDEGETDPNVADTFCSEDAQCGGDGQCVGGVCQPKDSAPVESGCGCGATNQTGGALALFAAVALLARAGAQRRRSSLSANGEA